MQEERRRLQEAEVDRTSMTLAKLGSPLDPLLASLAHFHSSSDLSAKIGELFRMIDANGSGSLDYQEICDGLQVCVRALQSRLNPRLPLSRYCCHLAPAQHCDPLLRPPPAPLFACPARARLLSVVC